VDRRAALEALAESTASIRWWFDHHQWDESTAAAVRDLGVDLVVGESDEECTADVALRSLDHDFDDRWGRAGGRDARPRPLDQGGLALRRLGRLLLLGRQRGVHDDRGRVRRRSPRNGPRVRRRSARREGRRIDAAVDRAVTHDIGEWTVAVTYGRCSQNEVAEALREQGADGAVIVKPAGSASIRGSEDFQHAHEVAGKVNGGGHPQAAGCKPDIYDDMLDYAQHWTTEGQACKRVILAAFEAVAEGSRRRTSRTRPKPTSRSSASCSCFPGRARRCTTTASRTAYADVDASANGLQVGSDRDRDEFGRRRGSTPRTRRRRDADVLVVHHGISVAGRIDRVTDRTWGSTGSRRSVR